MVLLNYDSMNFDFQFKENILMKLRNLNGVFSEVIFKTLASEKVTRLTP